MNKIALSVGYPLGSAEYKGKSYYVIESQSKYIHLNVYDVETWAKLVPPYDEDLSEREIYVDRLVSAGAAVIASDLNGLLTRIMKYKLYRQGIAVMNTDDSDMHEICIGDTVIQVNNQQMQIWRAGNGRATVSTIYEKIVAEDTEEISQQQEKQFVENILYLVSKEVLYLV